jgi:23S rRNA (uracil1939-C5)-methyltransferase
LLLTIDKLVYGGDGLARLPADEHGSGKAVFLPFTLEGERIEAALVEQKRGFARAQIEKVITASPQRVEPQCPYYGRCGGCHYQHAGYEHQLQIKAAILKENLRRLAKVELDRELTQHSSSPWNYRNRVRLQVRGTPEFEVGYRRFNSHELQAISQCPIASPLINRAIATLSQQKTASWAEGVEEIELFADAEDSGLLVEIECGPKIAASQAIRAAEELKSVLSEATGVVMRRRSGDAYGPGKQIALVGSGEIRYNVGEQPYRVSAGAFFQVNRHLISELVDLVTGGLSGESALDLYAGVGLFSTVLCRNFAQVTAVESSPTSHSDLLYNSSPNVKAVRATTEQFLGSAAGKLRPDLVVVDPPRNGLGEMVVRGLAGLGARRVVYVSCDPATLSRDLAGLLGAGYRFQQAHVVDLFPQTYHIESVFHLVR